MPVVPIKTESRCKLCKHARRGDIDALLEKRSNREKDEHGTPINLEYVLARLSEWGVANPNEDNIRAHWKRHCEVQSGEVMQRREAAATRVLDAFREGDRSVVVDADDALDFIIAQGVEEAAARIEIEGKAGVTLDQVLKAIDAKTKRKQSEATNEVLRALSGAIETSVGALVEGDAEEAEFEALPAGEAADA